MAEVFIYVKLVDEGIDVWRPVAAYRTGEETYRITEIEKEDSGESWEYRTGQTVRVELRVLSGESVLVAVAESPAPK